MAEPTDPMLGRIIGGKYRLVDTLGKGGMGKVYRAEQTGLDREVAVKIIRAEYAGNAELTARFRREAQIAARVRHRNVVTIYDYGITPEENLAYIVMEMIHGESLDDLIRQNGQIECRRAVDLMCEICQGVGAAHKRQILHRDIKPPNIMLLDDEGRETVKVMDFGIVKMLDNQDTAYTQTGQVMGSPPYMPPEMWKSKTEGEIDLRSDVYSLGITFYQMLTGKLPFYSDNPWGWSYCHLNEPPEPLPDEIPPELKSLVMRTLEKEHAKRPANALALREELIEYREAEEKKRVAEEQQRIEAERKHLEEARNAAEQERLRLSEEAAAKHQEAEYFRRLMESSEQLRREEEAKRREIEARAAQAEQERAELERRLRERESREDIDKTWVLPVDETKPAITQPAILPETQPAIQPEKEPEKPLTIASEPLAKAKTGLLAGAILAILALFGGIFGIWQWNLATKTLETLPTNTISNTANTPFNQPKTEATPTIQKTPNVSPTDMPETKPTVKTTASPETKPTVQPTVQPTTKPTVEATPTARPTIGKTPIINRPIVVPTRDPVVRPTISRTPKPKPTGKKTNSDCIFNGDC